MDNQEFTHFLRMAREVCEEHDDVATASRIEACIDEAERRSWFLPEIVKSN